MYKVKYGGKKGKTVELEESPDLVAVRTKGNKSMSEVKLSRSGQEAMDDSVPVVNFPEAGITVIKVGDKEAPPGEFESFGMARGELAAPPDTTLRDATRATLKQEDDIRFAGRVLQDKESGEVMLYTENFFVKFFDATPEQKCLDIIEKYQLTVKSKLPFAPNAYFVEASEGTGLAVFEIAEAILKEKIVEYCHPELVQERRFKGIHPLQWHLDKTQINGNAIDAHVNIQSAWKITKGKGVTIAIIDDGVDTDHPEFAGRVLHPFDATLNKYDARPVSPEDNHGTACAGMACAAGLKDGASGTAPEAFLMPIRLRSGLGSMAEANAFAWAADHGADVISCSWGPTDGQWWNPADPTHNRQTMLPDSTRLAMDYAMNKGRDGKGCVILFAAGNGNEPTANDGYVSHPGILTVGACNDTGRRSVYSDYGEQVWVSFPSGDFGWRAFQHPAPLSEGLRTTDRVKDPGYTTEGYVNSFGGTSGACPGMAGVVALLLATNPRLTPPQVKDLVRQSCVVIDAAAGEYDKNGHSIFYGYGRIDAGLAVKNAQKSVQEANATTIEGEIRFSGMGDVAVQHAQLTGITLSPQRKIMGLTLRIAPAVRGLSLKYSVNVSGEGITTSRKEGEYCGTSDGRRKVMGVAITLEGAAASEYEVIYVAQMEKSSALVTASNGDFCGSKTKRGKGIVALMVNIKKK